MRFTILGCYSPFAPYRGASSGYLLESNNIKIMIDCGNGSFANLQKFIEYTDLSCLIISHFHADHFYDIEMLRKAFALAHEAGKRKNPLIVYAPSNNEHYDKLASYPHLFAMIPLEESLEKDHRFGSMAVRFFECRHTIPCYGLKVKENGKKLAYTADTAFSQQIAEEVRKADYLFAEASLLEKDKNKCINGHMTARQAGQLAEIAQAEKLLLTHLNPIYNSKILKREAELEFSGSVEVVKMLKTYNI